MMYQGLAALFSSYMFALGAVLVASAFVIRLLRAQISYPPGPRGLPLLGVAREHPKTEFWKTYALWGKQYGTSSSGVISFHILGRRIVVLNSVEAATELLDKCSAIYSDRPFPTMSGLLMRRHKSIFLMKYGDRLKQYRKLMHQDFNVTASQKYWGVQESEAHRLVQNLTEDPSQLEKHLRKNAAAVIMKIAFGYTVRDQNDYFVAMAEESMRVGSLAASPGKWLVDSFPILRFLPTWFPGAGFHKQATEWGNQLYRQSLVPHNYVKKEMAAGTATPSFTSHHMQPPVSAELEDIVLWTAGALYAGAADTTVSTVKTFFCLMTLYPDIQRRAQAEIDLVVGPDRLPTMTDRPSLPYINNIIKEILRWAPPSAMGLPHAPAEDDTSSGYLIPKGCMVIANIWAILRDETLYPDPHVFNPERFDSTHGHPQPDPRQWAFGFGRRVCPGIHIAESTIFIQVATALATLSISRDVDGNGEEMVPKIAFTTAIVSYIKPFPYRIKSMTPYHHTPSMR